MAMEVALLVAMCFLLYAPTGSIASRFYPTNNQAVSPREELLLVQPQSGRAEVPGNVISELHTQAINVAGSTQQEKEFGPTATLADQPAGPAGNFFAVHIASGDFHGFVATLDVYGLSLNPQQLSRAAIWVMNAGDGAPSNQNAIQIGWEVSPFTYGDSKTHFVTAWTRDGYKQTGCYNTKCPGFKPESGATIAPGAIIDTLSRPNGAKQNLTIKLIKDSASSGDWLVHYGLNTDDPKLIGRFPKSIFTGLADKATDIHFGGLVGTSTSTGNPTPMGSGFLPANSAAASFSHIQLIDRNGDASLVTGDLPAGVTNPNLYKVTPIVNGAFFYGGPKQPTG